MRSALHSRCDALTDVWCGAPRSAEERTELSTHGHETHTYSKLGALGSEKTTIAEAGQLSHVFAHPSLWWCEKSSSRNTLPHALYHLGSISQGVGLSFLTTLAAVPWRSLGGPERSRGGPEAISITHVLFDAARPSDSWLARLGHAEIDAGYGQAASQAAPIFQWCTTRCPELTFFRFPTRRDQSAHSVRGSAMDVSMHSNKGVSKAKTLLMKADRTWYASFPSPFCG
eukprot:2462139-Rhodomonas_salina.2